jgi:hypothetical protein
MEKLPFILHNDKPTTMIFHNYLKSYFQRWDHGWFPSRNLSNARVMDSNNEHNCTFPKYTWYFLEN